VVAHVTLASALALWMGGRLVSTLIDGAAPALVERRINSIVGSPGGLLVLVCFAGPLGFLGGLFERVPTRGGPRWMRWLTGGGHWQDAAPLSATPSRDVVHATDA
jgi:hypothetical protein